MTQSLVILRGIPGSGKSEVANVLSGYASHIICTSDDFFITDGEYIFNPELLSVAHNACQEKCENLMKKQHHKIFIANTNTTEEEMQPYVELAEYYGYVVYYLIVENRHNGVSSHEMPESVYHKMFNRFEIKLLNDTIKKSVIKIKPIKSFFKHIKKFWK